MTSITLPTSLESIGNRAFADCSSLTSITLPETLTSIGNSAFEGCSSLTKIVLPEKVTIIGDSAFNNCSSLTTIDIHTNDEVSINISAFEGCSESFIINCIINSPVHQFLKENKIPIAHWNNDF